MPKDEPEIVAAKAKVINRTILEICLKLVALLCGLAYAFAVVAGWLIPFFR